MALSSVEVCNRALDAIGQAAITALDEGTVRADICNRLYADLRNELLQDHPWNFAIRRASLAALADAPEWGWLYQYQYPSDCLRVLGVNGMQLPGLFPINQPPFQPPTWEAENRRILTDYPAPLEILYITDSVSEIYFPPKFTAALVLRIAMDLAMPLTESGARVDALAKRFMTAIASARGSDARENGPRSLTNETLINARY